MMKSPVIGTIFLRIFVFLMGMMLVLPAMSKLYIYSTYRYLGSTVYGIVDHPASARDMGGRPLLRYHVNGNVYEFKTKAKTHWFRKPEKGEKIKIFIHRSDPQKAIANSLFFYVLLPLFFLAVGCYCCFIAVFNRKGMSWR